VASEAYANLPPGPRNNLLATLSFVRDTYAFFAENRKRYGDPFTLPTQTGPLVVTGDPELVKVIFSADPDMFEPFAVGLIAPFLGRQSVIMTGGEKHRRDRKLLTPPFHGARMRAYGQTIVDATRALTRDWRTGWTGPVQPTTAGISLDIMVRAVFGIQDDRERDRWSEAIRRDIGAIGPLIIFLPLLRRDFLGLGPWSKFKRTRARFDALILGEIASRRARSAQGEDILSLIMSARYDDGSAMSD
jgi:cytochrome P450